jgi:hypothetical protein
VSSDYEEQPQPPAAPASSPVAEISVGLGGAAICTRSFHRLNVTVAAYEPFVISCSTGSGAPVDRAKSVIVTAGDVEFAGFTPETPIAGCPWTSALELSHTGVGT